MTKLHKVFLLLLTTTTANANHEFYLHGALGGLLQNKPSAPKDLNDPDSIYKVKKTTPAPEMSLGVGHKLSSKVRSEIIFVKPFLNKSRVILKEENATDFQDYAFISTIVNSLQLRGYLDIYDMYDSYKIYLGAGIGTSHIKGKLKDASNPAEWNSEFKHKYNFTYTFAAGTSFHIPKDLKLDLEYNYNDYGKAKSDFYTTSLRGHSIVAKLRLGL